MDKTLLEKVLRQGEMTSIEIGQMFGMSPGRVAKYRREYGLMTPKTYICNACKHDFAACVFKAEHSGLCLTCRIKLGYDKPHQKAGPGRGKIKQPNKPVQLVKRKCLKCDKVFMTPLDCTGYPLNSFCPVHQKTNSYLGYEETAYGSEIGTRHSKQSVLRFG